MTTESPLWERRVTYASVGGTQAEDLLEFPPRWYRPAVRRARIGHGDARFVHAATTALSWGIQKRSGFEVDVEATPAEVTDGTYVAVGFSTKGIPVVPAGGDRMAGSLGPDGTPLLKPGDSATLRRTLGPVAVECPVRVIYVVDDPACKGFAYGTLPGHPERGEEAFLVEQEEDGSVWLTIKAFSRPAGIKWWLASPILRIVQARTIGRYLRALAGPIPKGEPMAPATGLLAEPPRAESVRTGPVAVGPMLSEAERTKAVLTGPVRIEPLLTRTEPAEAVFTGPVPIGPVNTEAEPAEAVFTGPVPVGEAITEAEPAEAVFTGPVRIAPAVPTEGDSTETVRTGPVPVGPVLTEAERTKAVLTGDVALPNAEHTAAS